jgi:hypothetical protein
MAMKIGVVVFWVTTPRSDMVGCQREDGGSIALRNVGILPEYYMVS